MNVTKLSVKNALAYGASKILPVTTALRPQRALYTRYWLVVFLGRRPFYGGVFRAHFEFPKPCLLDEKALKV